jgi:hypothetical protein
MFFEFFLTIFPILRRVTGLTICAEFSQMHIFMAIGALIANMRKNQSFVTGPAGNLAVQS